MDITGFTKQKTGQLVRVEDGNWAFVPDTLPPSIDLPMSVVRLLSDADSELGRLCGMIDHMTDPESLFLSFLRREAVLSSRIEGTRTTLKGLVLFEATQEDGNRDEREVSNYVEALQFGLKRCAEIPLGRTLIRELHRRLMHGIEKPNLSPGKERGGQVLVGGGDTYQTASYVPPPAHFIPPLMENLDAFLNEESLPVLVRAAIAHYQFEAIHPFADGNGRIGRMLISLMLRKERRLSKPLLYMSAYFERLKLEYYRQLLSISQRASWEEWLRFFLVGVKQQARDSAIRADRLYKLRETYREMFSTARVSGTIGKLIGALFERPVITVPWAMKLMKVGYKPAKESINKLVAAGILERSTKWKKMQVYLANGILETVESPTEEIAERELALS